ncbi:hypothetical protein EBZ39_18940 [bacterium]|nr:hypothetical protein [bacterium]
MVRAILDGSKTQTRRIVKRQPKPHHWEAFPTYKFLSRLFDAVKATFWITGHSQEERGKHHRDDGITVKCPYGSVGDQLWVRETFRLYDRNEECACYEQCSCPPSGTPIYRADSSHESKWKPSIFMPRWASRINLKITGIRVERLQDISGDDAWAEGVPCASWAESDWDDDGYPTPWEKRYRYALEQYEELWESINGPGSWDANPYVWVIGFEVVK